MLDRIIIVGAGFCGTVLAASLLRGKAPRPTEIVLVERGPEIGRGVAYAVHDYPYVLNVPAGRLSADAADPLQFLRFAQATFPHADAEDFLPRQLYGDYLQEFLAQAEQAAAPHVKLTRVFDAATRISRRARAAPLCVHFARHEAAEAGRVVLALGNPPPPLLPWAEPVRHHPAYRDDPRVLPALHQEHSAVIVGNGLTMADVLLLLSRDSARTPRLTTISRRGLVPLPQTTFRPSAIQGDGSHLLAKAGSIRQVLAASRVLAREAAALGGDWREVVTFIRTLAPSIWQRLPELERRRFLRHLQSYWDVHRHRLPPQMADRVDALRRSGRLEINAGRIDAVTAEGDRLRVTWRRRGSAQASSVVADAVINAMGPDYALKRTRDALVHALRSDGWVSEDALDLGLRTTPSGACVAADGSANEQLYYVGPMLRAGHWEATAAVELRTHVEQLARHLLATAPAGA